MTEYELKCEKNKPRICEVLGVEPLQKWKVPERSSDVYRINGDGCIQRENNAGVWLPASMPVSLLIDIIDQPELIAHLPRWTADDIADVKAVLQIWPDTSEITRLSCTTIRICTPVYHNLPSQLFPSLRIGEFVSPGEILETET